eukprot:9209640-Pyramimonas_sp.AAC.1
MKPKGIRASDLLRRVHTRNGEYVVRLIDSDCKSHRLQVRLSYSAETLAAARNLETATRPLPPYLS